MSACWASRLSGRGGLALALALAAALAVPADAQKRISVSQKGVVIEADEDSAAGDSAGDWDRDWISVDHDGDAVVRVFGDIHIPPGERVRNDVVAVFGSARVEGEVDGDVVAVFGSVELGDEAVVGGEVVAIGGVLKQGSGSEVGGESVSVGLAPVSWGIPALSCTLGAVATGWIAAVFTGWIFTLLFPTRFLRVATTATRRTGVSLLLGLASLPGCAALIVLLFVTVVGIPLAFLTPLAFAVIAYGGQLAATYVLGSKLTGRSLGSGGLLGPIVVGTLFVAVFFGLGAILFAGPSPGRPFGLFAVLVGALLTLGLTLIGTGAFLLSRLGSDPKDVVWGVPAAPAMATPGGVQPAAPA